MERNRRSRKNVLRFPRAWPQSPREQRPLSAGPSPHAIPVGVYVRFSLRSTLLESQLLRGSTYFHLLTNNENMDFIIR